MHLDSTLDALEAQHDLPAAGGRAREAELTELSMISNADDVRAVAELVFRKVAPADEQLAAALHQSLGEVGANVGEHPGTRGFVAAQTMPALQELRFAVADSGAGRLTTLARRGAVSDAAAIGLALDGVSRFDAPDR